MMTMMMPSVLRRCWLGDKKCFLLQNPLGWWLMLSGSGTAQSTTWVQSFGLSCEDAQDKDDF